MIGLPWWGTVITAVIMGGGAALWLMRTLKQAAADKTRADNNQAHSKAEAEADATEAKMKKAVDDALHSNFDTTDL